MIPTLKSAKTLILAASALAISAAVTLPAAAQDAAPPAPPPTDQTMAPPAPPMPPTALPLRAQIMFNLLDQNGDGTLDQQEINALEKAIFTAMDKNHDGKLAPDEFRMGDRGPGAGGFGMGGDRNGRGPGFNGPGFHRGGPGWGMRGDKGPDGNRGPRFQRFGQNQDAPGVNGDVGGPGAGPQSFASLDTNGDGVISQDEFAAAGPGFGPGLMNPGQ